MNYRLCTVSLGYRHDRAQLDGATTDVGWMGIFTDDDAAAPTGWIGHQMAVVVALAMTASVSVGVVVAEGISNLSNQPPESDPPAADPPDVAAPDPPVVLPEQPPAPPWSPPEDGESIGSGSTKEPEVEAATGGTGDVAAPPGPQIGVDLESAGPEWLPDGGDGGGPVRPPGDGVELPDGFFDGMPGDLCDSMPVLCGDISEDGPVTWPPNGWGLSDGHLDALTEAGLAQLVMPDGEVVVIDLVDLEVPGLDAPGLEPGVDSGDGKPDVGGDVEGIFGEEGAEAVGDGSLGYGSVDSEGTGGLAEGGDVSPPSWQDEGGDTGDETADEEWPVSDQDSGQVPDGDAATGPEAGEDADADAGTDVEADLPAPEPEPDHAEEAAPQPAPEDSPDGSTGGVDDADDEGAELPPSGQGDGEEAEPSFGDAEMTESDS